MGHVLAAADFADVAHGCIDSMTIGGSKDWQAHRHRRNPATGAGLHLK
jgi:hypothetical protein